MGTDELLPALETAVGAGNVLTGDAVGAQYHVDFSGEDACAPAAVVRPASTDELAAVVRACHDAGRPIVVQGGLTGLAGGATPQAGEIALSLERLAGVEHVDTDSMTLTVRAGTPLQSVQEAAAGAGCLFPLDLGARGSCTIGGNIATNAGGNQVLRFGMMRNLVLGLEAVLADGTVVSSMNRMLKNNAGYDLKQLFIGTEGTLGIVTRAVLRLYPRFARRNTALCAAHGLEDAIALLHRLSAGLAGTLSSFEAMWSGYFEHVVEHVESASSPFDERHGIYMLVESEGAEPEADRERLENVLAAALEDGVISDAAVAQSGREADAFWAIRDGIAEITPGLMPMLAFDVSMPIAEMAAFLERVDAELDRRFERVTNLVFGHLGDCNLHLAVTTGREADFDALCEAVYAATAAHDGSVSAEHGIGMHKRRYLPLARTPAELDLMRRLKAALDPNGILNPQRVIPERA